ncbi:MAG: hypothetical protein ACYTF7_08550 [Planctomycetota bacterium]|jgi:hypothetical protein
MQNISRLIKHAAIRTAINRLLAGWVLSAIAVSGVVLLAIIADRLFVLDIPWRTGLIVVASIGFGAPVVWVLVRWPTRMRVAQDLDERAGLRSTLSTALSVSTSEDPWSHAVVDHATSLSSRVSARAALPLRPPRRWEIALMAPAVLLAAHLAIPQLDLLGRQARADDILEEQEEIVEAQSQANEARKTIESTVESLGINELDDQQASTEPSELNKPESPESIRKAAIRDLTELGERLRQIRSDTKGESLDDLERRLRELRTSGDGPLDEMMRALQRGNIGDAREKLQGVMEGLDSSELDDEYRERLQEQLESLANQMGQLATKQEEFSRQLSDAGLQPLSPGDLAKNPMAMQQAIQNAEGLSQEQRDQLMQQMQSLQQTNSLLDQMQQAAQSAQQCMNPSQGSQQGQQSQQSQQGQQGQQGQASQQSQSQSSSGMSPQEGMQQLDDALAQMEMLQQEMQMLDAAQQDVWGQMSELSGALGEDPSSGSVNMLELWDRRGPPQGRGSGGAPEGAAQQAPFSLDKQRAIGKDHGGPAIATRYVEGEQVRGESTAEFREVVQASAENASEAIESQRIPREYHDVIKHYFGRLESKVDPESPAEDEPATDEDDTQDQD